MTIGGGNLGKNLTISQEHLASTERDEHEGYESYASLTRRHYISNPEDSKDVASHIFGQIKIIDHKSKQALQIKHPDQETIKSDSSIRHKEIVIHEEAAELATEADCNNPIV